MFDFGSASISQENESQHVYSGTKFFASDAICEQLQDADWSDHRISHQYVDDLESLLKTALYILDFECHNIVTLAVRQQNAKTGGTLARPKDVLHTWNRIWSTTQLGTIFKAQIDFIRRNPELAHDHVVQWLQNIGWSQTWVGL